MGRHRFSFPVILPIYQLLYEKKKKPATKRCSALCSVKEIGWDNETLYLNLLKCGFPDQGLHIFLWFQRETPGARSLLILSVSPPPLHRLFSSLTSFSQGTDPNLQSFSRGRWLLIYRVTQVCQLCQTATCAEVQVLPLEVHLRVHR